MAVFILAVFLSAFLLFQVQPVIARFILPWYGGSPSVWSTCMLFFQLGLVVGYAYTHLLVTAFRNRRHLQIGIHFTLVALALFTLPITPDPAMKPGPEDTQPILGIIKLLAKTVGIPYVILSASGPLVQHWFSRVYPDRSPFRLYAVSNIGSLLALLSYPFLFEVYLTVSRQSLLWSLGFGFYAFVLLATSFVFGRSRLRASYDTKEAIVQDKVEAGMIPSRTHYLRWILLSACGSVLLLSVTTQICQDVAVVPFFWAIPLSLYLLSFIIAFDHSRWYSRPFVIPLAAISVSMTIVLLNSSFESGDWPYVWQIVIYCSALFFSCLLCHGEIVRLKPTSRFLTEFYLAISVGGALGGIFVSLVAPQIFDSYHELQVGILLLAILITWQLFPDFQKLRRRLAPKSKSGSPFKVTLVWSGALLWFATICLVPFSLHTNTQRENEDVISSSRGFFGVLKVTESHAKTGEIYRTLLHGQITHGVQFVDSKLSTTPTTYFGKKTGIGAAFEFIPQRFGPQKDSLYVGVIGLGVGTIAAYALPDDYFRFYEINPDVIALARSHFTCLKDCQGDVSVILGDGRVSLERELAQRKEKGNRFDILIIDAFSGDSIPMHLLTKEAFRLYAKHLKNDGVLAVHITNRHVDLSDPIRTLANQDGWTALRLISPPDGRLAYGADWTLITKNQGFIKELRNAGRVYHWEREKPKNLLWTDDFHNLLEVLK